MLNHVRTKAKRMQVLKKTSEDQDRELEALRDLHKSASDAKDMKIESLRQEAKQTEVQKKAS